MSYNLNFKISSICDSSAVATSISYHGNVSSYLSCCAMCVNNLECITFLFFLANSTCFLKNDAVAEIQTCGDDDIRYGEMLSVDRGICTRPAGNVRLCNGTRNGAADKTMGRVEVFLNGHWGSVCDDFWEVGNSGYENAEVVCKMFGFMGGVAHIQAYFGVSSGPIFIDDVLCSGTESSILECPHNSSHNCIHQEDVGVVCS